MMRGTMLAASTGKGKLAFDLGESCATSPTRTDNIQLRRLALYPVELRAHGLGHRVLVREEEAAAARSLLALPQNDELVLLQKYATETQVDIQQGALLSAGVFATVRDDGMYHQLLISKEDLATARKVLEKLSEARP